MRKKLLLLLMSALLLMTALLGCSSDKTKLSDSAKWANASYAPLTKANDGDYTQLGGYPKTEAYAAGMQEMLEQQWSITDHDSLILQINWLQGDSGNNADFLREMKEMGFLDQNTEERANAIAGYDATSQDYLINMFVAYDRYGDNAIAAWDLVRANSLAGMGYIAGYCTEEECLEMSLSISQKLQSLYNSWDEMFDSYILGYCYWSGENVNDETSHAYERKGYYDSLHQEKNGPYSLAWDTTLEKDWN